MNNNCRGPKLGPDPGPDWLMFSVFARQRRESGLWVLAFGRLRGCGVGVGDVRFKGRVQGAGCMEQG